MSSSNYSKREINVGGLVVNVHSYQPPQDDPRIIDIAPLKMPVAVLFLLHGRFETQESRYDVVSLILERINGYSSDHQDRVEKELVVVTFDQRNHGSRLVSKIANLGWDNDTPRRHNPNHATDMYAIYAGTARDVSFLIDILPSYLYPGGTREVVEWMCAGISLGGHATWMVLRHEPRINIGIPIIGCPDYIKLMDARAEKHGLKLGPPLFPDSLKAVVERDSPTSVPFDREVMENPFIGKKILVLSGKEDTLVHWEASKQFVGRLCVGGTGLKEYLVEEGAGHEVTLAMKDMAATFIWEHSISTRLPSRL